MKNFFNSIRNGLSVDCVTVSSGRKTVVNGVEINVQEGSNVTIKNGKVYVDGKPYVPGEGMESIDDKKAINIIINGNVGKIVCGGDVTCHEVHGHVDAGSSVRCGNVTGNVDAGSSVECGDVGQSVDAGSSVHCRHVGGNVDAGSSVTCGEVHGTIDAGGRVTINK